MARDIKEIARDLAKAKREAEQDPVYDLNAGLHMKKINDLFDELGEVSKD